MLTGRLPLTALPRRELALAALGAGATALIGFAGVHKLGTAGLLTPLALALVAILLVHPRLAVAVAVVTPVICEGPTFGIFTIGAQLYEQAYKDVSPVDGLVVLAVAAVAIDLMRRRRPLHVPRAMVVPLVLLALAMIAGVVVGRENGASLRHAVTAEHVLAYLLVLPVAIVNLELDRRELVWLIGAVFALAGVKAVLGLVEVAGHLGSPIEGAATLTYYEPTANWLIMIATLGIFAGVLARARAWPPLWMLLTSPLLLACLLLSYRRSFWIAAVLGLLLVLMLGTTALGRRLLVPGALGIAAAIWLLGSISFQTQLPIVKRAATLTPSKLQANAEDRYRLDERANVLAEIRAHPITGLGMTIPWSASAQTLSLEGEGQGRQYVHFAALWFWLKLGILGLFAYAGIILSSMWLALRAWRASSEPMLRAFGLASLCGIVGLLAIETTASFSGVDQRFTALLAAQIGLLALTVRTAELEPTAR